MRALNDCGSCALAPAAKAIDATASVTNVFTGSLLKRLPHFQMPHAGGRDHSRAEAAPSRGRDHGKQWSAPDAEEVPQQRRRLSLADAAIDLRSVLAGRGGEVAHAALDRAALGVGGAVIEPADAGER